MTKKSLLWQIYPTYLIVTVLAIVLVSWFSTTSFKSFYLAETEKNLLREANILKSHISLFLQPEERIQLQELCMRLGRNSETRITVILPDGKVVADSVEDPAKMENHADRPEIREAYAKRTGTQIRPSPSLNREIYMYVAVPITINGHVDAVVRTSFSLKFVESALVSLYIKIALAGLAIVVLIGLLSLYVSRRISLPIERLRAGAERFANGDLSHKIEAGETKETSDLAEAMNQMASQLDGRMKEVTSQRNERDAILSSMIEGVIAVDLEQNVLILNNASSRFFDFDPDSASGRSFHEVIRNSDLQKLVTSLLDGASHIESEIALLGEKPRYFQVIGTALLDVDESRIGALLVIHDVTRLRKLETIRRDFVANVSHELRTPITSIKGFVETLSDGAIDNPGDARRFLGIISKQADRLNAIIDDLLALSHIEQKGEDGSITLEYHRLKPVLDSAVDACTSNAASKNIVVEIVCEADIELPMNPQLLEQAIVNLVDNALKFSDSGSRVRVYAVYFNDEIVISVEDKGCGIPQEHHERLFERFYRVDRARSRTLGGTGLGLSIVKHIAKIHGGWPEVKSSTGLGSTFSIRIPMKTRQLKNTTDGF